MKKREYFLDIYQMGRNWHDAGGRFHQNPFVYGTWMYASWRAGFVEAKQESEKMRQAA